MKNKIFQQKMSRKLITVFTALLLLSGMKFAWGQSSWARTYGGINSETANSIQRTSDGGIIVAGETESFGAGVSDFWVLKLNSSGNFQWQKTFGGGGHDRGYSVQATTDGGFIVAGTTESFGAGSADFWVLKLDSSGNVQWQKTYGGSNDDSTSSIQITMDGGFIVAGSTDSFGAGGFDFWVLKLDSSGNVLWEKTYGGMNEEVVSSIQITTDGGFVVAGNSFGAGGLDIWVLKLDSSGNMQWQKIYGGGGDDFASSIQVAPNGSFVCGHTASFSQGSNDSWILKLDSDGSIDSSCSFIADTSISPSDSNSTVNEPVATVTDSVVLPVSSNSTVMDTTIVSQQQCSATCLFSDDFENGVMASNWDYGNGSWVEFNGNLTGSDPGKDSAVANPVFAGCINCTVTALVSTSGGVGNLSLLGWYVNQKNYVEVTLREDKDKLIFKQKINGSVVLKQKVKLNILPDQAYEVQVSFDGMLFHVSVDGTLILVADPSIVPFGTVGFSIKNTLANFHEIFVD